jgi:hypothetical protein
VEPRNRSRKELGGLRFRTESPVDGHIEIEFLRNEEGIVTECMVVAEQVGLNAKGVRVGGAEKPPR